jgi:hypothetical protein
MSPISGWLDRLRQPEYTGENRCTPCTVVNLTLAAALGLALATVWPPFGVLAFATSVGAIYLRGYLVPYTPTITKQYFPDRVLRWFDKESGRPSADQVEDIDVEETLYDLGVVTECEHVDDLCLEAAFQQRWREHVTDLREKETRTEDVLELLDLDPDGDHELAERGGSAVIIMIDGNQVGQWESDAALVADLAADKVLREWSDEWERFHVINRSQLLNSLRMFVEQCPMCDSPVTVDQETVESCCRSYDVVAVTCDGCGSRLFEIELTDEMREQL